MQLQNPQQNEQLQALIVKANEAIATFDELQRKATEIHTNIERNKKTIEALQNENAELQAKSDKVTISETGEVDFSEFDDYSNQIFANNRKIKALEKVINKFENELELLVLTDYNITANKAETECKKALNYYSHILLNELFDEKTVNKLNTVYSLLRMSGNTNSINLIMDTLKVQFNGDFVADVSPIVFPSKKFKYKNENNIVLLTRRIQELKRELGK